MPLGDVDRANERIVFEQDEFGWVFERSNTLCVARGNFEGEDGKTAFIELRKDSPADIVKVLMVSEGLSMPRTATAPVGAPAVNSMRPAAR